MFRHLVGLCICIVGVLVNALPVVKDVKDADAKIVEDISRTRPVTPMVNHILSRTEQYYKHEKEKQYDYRDNRETNDDAKRIVDQIHKSQTDRRVRKIIKFQKEHFKRRDNLWNMKKTLVNGARRFKRELNLDPASLAALEQYLRDTLLNGTGNVQLRYGRSLKH